MCKVVGRQLCKIHGVDILYMMTCCFFVCMVCSRIWNCKSTCPGSSVEWSYNTKPFNAVVPEETIIIVIKTHLPYNGLMWVSNWWFQPTCKNISQSGSSSQLLGKIKNVPNHHIYIYIYVYIIPTWWMAQLPAAAQLLAVTSSWSDSSPGSPPAVPLKRWELRREIIGGGKVGIMGTQWGYTGYLKWEYIYIYIYIPIYINKYIYIYICSKGFTWWAPSVLWIWNLHEIGTYLVLACISWIYNYMVMGYWMHHGV